MGFRPSWYDRWGYHVYFYSFTYFYFFNFLFYIGVQLINNVVLVSGLQQSDSVTHVHVSAAAAKSLQSCPTLCDPIDSSPPGSSVPGILQARKLEWVAITFSNA